MRKFWQFNLFKKAESGKMKSLINQLFRFVGVGSFLNQSDSAQTLVKDTFAKIPEVYSAISLITQKARDLKFYLYKKTKDGTEEMREHDLLSLIIKGSAIGDMTFEDVIEFLLTDLLATGQSFLIKHRGVSGKLLGFYPFPSAKIEAIYVGGEEILEYRVIYTNETIKREDVIHFKIPNVLGEPQDYYSGFSPLTSAKGLLEQVRSADISQSAMFRNGGAQGMMFPDASGEFRDLKKEDLDVIKEAYHSSYAGENSRGKKFGGAITTSKSH
jgi:HK97 family phage portal protein